MTVLPRLSLTVSYWEIIVVLLTDVWPPRLPEATESSTRSDDIIWDLQHSSGIIRPPRPTTAISSFIPTLCCTDWLTMYCQGCYTKLNQVILAGPLMGREILCSNQINQLENPLQMCGRTEHVTQNTKLRVSKTKTYYCTTHIFQCSKQIYLYRIGSYYYITITTICGEQHSQEIDCLVWSEAATQCQNWCFKVNRN